MKKNILYYIFLAGVLVMAASGQEIDSSYSYDSSSDDFMELDGDIEDLEDLEVLDLEPSSDENNRYLRVGHGNGGAGGKLGGWGGFNSGGMGGFNPGDNWGGSNSGGWGGSNQGSSNSGQLRAPRKPNLRNKPRAPQGWKQAKRNRHYHGFYLHTYCDCVFGNWFCFCVD